MVNIQATKIGFKTYNPFLHSIRTFESQCNGTEVAQGEPGILHPWDALLLLCLQQEFYISAPFKNAAILRNTDV